MSIEYLDSTLNYYSLPLRARAAGRDSRKLVRGKTLRIFLSIPLMVGAISCCCAASWSQTKPTPPPRPSRDSRAVGVIQTAISKLGGAANINQITDWKVIAQRQASAASQTQSGQVIWEAAGTEFKSDFPAASGRSILTSGHGNPVRAIGGVTEPVAPYVLRSRFVPILVGAVLLGELQDPNWSFELMQQDTGDNGFTIVKTYSVANPSDRVATEQNWFFDSGTGLPTRVEYRFPDPKHPTLFGNASADFSDYRPTLNVLYPFQIVMSQNGIKMADVTIQSIMINSNLSPQQFDTPASLAGPGG